MATHTRKLEGFGDRLRQVCDGVGGFRAAEKRTSRARGAFEKAIRRNTAGFQLCEELTRLNGDSLDWLAGRPVDRSVSARTNRQTLGRTLHTEMVRRMRERGFDDESIESLPDSAAMLRQLADQLTAQLERDQLARRQAFLGFAHQVYEELPPNQQREAAPFMVKLDGLPKHGRGPAPVTAQPQSFGFVHSPEAEALLRKAREQFEKSEKRKKAG
jgi:hypothetical protein